MLWQIFATNFFILIIIGNDWVILAEKIGCEPLEVTNLKLKESPTEGALLYAMRNDLSVGELEVILTEMERYDVMEGCKKLIGTKSYY